MEVSVLFRQKLKVKNIEKKEAKKIMKTYSQFFKNRVDVIEVEKTKQWVHIVGYRNNKALCGIHVHIPSGYVLHFNP